MYHNVFNFTYKNIPVKSPAPNQNLSLKNFQSLGKKPPAQTIRDKLNETEKTRENLVLFWRGGKCLNILAVKIFLLTPFFNVRYNGHNLMY
ncbi:hypothetical protein COT20_00545 [bacterium (Candidatus Gribaldobacteria) CG08_land_8_20_14_0_20_39_15]|uniref:Uncharacterized protein n=1 Tax=bacterium (Candidatus Gribaldobacteria) CG08_land_8_20_14_0_20_39_15 TaxID=2014273 RepID=A0A2M6XV70_9BACT|nr:MAG: hypothetical protein COT20_00545 [bacterium (Candidatus Gribaldobacteria) CG08_land_8_20_14_0_20_39_15]